MPIRDYQCKNCGFELLNQLESITQPIPEHICPDCDTKLTVLFGTFSIGGCSETKEYREKRDRFRRRNKRLEAMPEKQQDGFKKLIDKTGGKRYLP